jgi:hypothetical protein
MIRTWWRMPKRIFGGFFADNYRALTMLSPWIFRCLLDKEFSPPLPVLHEKPRDKWTMKENAACLKVRGIKVVQKSLAFERTSQVDGYFNQPNGPPSVVPNITPSSTDICHLLLLLFHIFGTLISTGLNDEKAGNGFDALALQFLDWWSLAVKQETSNLAFQIWNDGIVTMPATLC